jgi:hypothetical protein
MRLLTDGKFLLTTLLVFTLISVIVPVVNALFGGLVAGVTGGALGAGAVGIFREFDKLSAKTTTIDLSWPSYLSWPVLAGVLVMQGAPLFKNLWLVPWRMASGTMAPCSIVAIVGSIILAYAAYVFCGYVVGRTLPERALAVATTGAVLGAIADLPNSIFTAIPLALSTAGSCFGYIPTDAESEFASRLGGSGGLVIAAVLSVALSVLGARLGAKHSGRGDMIAETEPTPHAGMLDDTEDSILRVFVDTDGSAVVLEEFHHTTGVSRIRIEAALDSMEQRKLVRRGADVRGVVCYALTVEGRLLAVERGLA